MNFRFTAKWYLLSGVILVLLIVLVDRVEDIVTHIEYPMDVWRMDLDDMLANLGFFLVGLASIIALWRKSDRTERKAELTAHQINGGMGDIAREHVNGALRDADVELGLWRRVDALEESNEDCVREKNECLAKNEELRRWVIARLDQTPLGREGVRNVKGSEAAP